MFTKIRTNEKGFTLIELLIVVAIIGILAAIAIPQFAAYRIRGYNSAANSDLRNLKVAEESFVSDWQVYASTIGCVSLTPACAGGTAGVGALLAGPMNYTVSVAALSINTQYPAGPGTMLFGLSSGVIGAITTTTTTGANYAVYTGHTNGDIIYGADSDLTQIKQAGKSLTGTIVALNAKAAGGALTVVPASTAATDDLAAAQWANM